MQIKYLPHAGYPNGLERSTAGAAGYNLRACGAHGGAFSPRPWPPMHYACVNPGEVVAFGTGIIDPDYHGEIIVKLRNVSDEPIQVNAFDRIAQILFVPVFFPAWEVVEEFTRTTERGTSGFGSTGVL